MLAVTEDFWRWQPHPEVWVLVAGVAALYLLALRTIGPRAVPAGGRVATRANIAWFGLGIAVLWLASDWPMHDVAEEYLYSVHMVQHLLLTFVLAPVMLLATPEWLARLVLDSGRVGRLFLKLARPIPAAVVFNGVQLLTHWQLVVNNSVENGLLHYGLHTVVVATALAVWMPIVSPLPEYRITPPTQCVHLFLTSIIPTVPGAWLALSDGVVYSAYDTPARLFGISATSDQQAAGLIMKLGGGMYLWTIIILIFFRWALTQDRGTSARRAVVTAEGTVFDDTDALTVDDVQRAFDRAGPPPEEPVAGRPSRP